MDFRETAAIIENCDLVLSSDTSVAHLAGALGKSTYLLLHHSSEWRWGQNEGTSPWYDFIEIFRQKNRGDWLDVIIRIKAEIVTTQVKNKDYVNK